MKTKVKVLILSILFLIVLIEILVIRHTKEILYPDIIELGTIKTYTNIPVIDKVWETSEYYRMQGIVIIAEVVDNKPVEVIDLGEIGILGSQLHIDNVDSAYSINNTMYAQTQQNQQNQNDTSDNTDSGSTSENIVDESESDNEPEPIRQYKPSVVEYVSAENSAQKFNYIVYAPENADETTPVFLFLHGIGENGTDYQSFMNIFVFLKYLISEQWQPNFVVVAPIMVRGSRWSDEGAEVRSLLSEVIDNYGGSWSNLYIGGFSAGCDAITPLTKVITFQGAIYMAGYLGGAQNTTDVNTFLNTWRGKNVFYFRDTLYGNGGYGYQADYVNRVAQMAPQYNINYIQVDMNWDHRSAMVDAILLPGFFMDNKGEYCHDAITDLIY